MQWAKRNLTNANKCDASVNSAAMPGQDPQPRAATPTGTGRSARVHAATRSEVPGIACICPEARKLAALGPLPVAA